MALRLNTSLAGFVVLALISFFPAISADDISCAQAITDLLPCQAFLLGFSDISVPCCQGAQTLFNSVANSLTDRKIVCECIKQALLTFGVNLDRAQQLPQLCKIDINVPIRPDVDCNKIPMNEGIQAHNFEAQPRENPSSPSYDGS